MGLNDRGSIIWTECSENAASAGFNALASYFLYPHVSPACGSSNLLFIMPSYCNSHMGSIVRTECKNKNGENAANPKFYTPASNLYFHASPECGSSHLGSLLPYNHTGQNLLTA